MKIVLACLVFLAGARVVYSLLGRAEQVAQGPQYSAAGKEAVEFAEKELAKRQDLQPAWQNLPENQQFMNPDIARLQTLYIESKKRLENLHQKALDGNGRKVWMGVEVQRAANCCMQIAFAVGMKALDDLEELRKKAAGEPQALSLENGDAFRASSFALLETYHLIRSEAEWTSFDDGSIGFKSITTNHPSEGYSANFYLGDGLYAEWRALYNEYCDRLQQATGSLEVNITRWSALDVNAESFIPPSCDLPEALSR